jgi:hypothetical protein
LRVENAELLGALGAGLAQLPAREVRFAPVVVPDSLPLSALDAIASRAGASPVERALAAVDGSIVAFLRSPFYEGYLARAERTKQLMREAGPALAGCLALSNFTARGLCRCPTLGGSQ